MPVTERRKSGKGVPGKAANPNRKRKYAAYRANSTCWCGQVFRSPKKKEAHALSEKH